MIEIFHFLFNAVTSSRSSGGISGMYSSFGRQIFESTDPQAAAKSIAGLRKKLRERKPSDSKFDADFEEVIFTKNVSSQKALVQYILKKVSLEECQTTVGDTDDLTIEHFLPEAKQKDGVPESIIGQIGNLFLVDSETNSQLASKDFVTKKDILLRRGYKLPQAFLEAEEITDDLIRANTLRVANLARTKVWKL